jgi:hypothetical protein
LLRKLQCRLIERIYVVQRMTPSGARPMPGNRLTKKYVLEPVREVQLESDELLRISRVVPHDEPGTIREVCD